MNKENLQSNLKYFITEEVQDSKRVFKIVDGTHFPMKEAHVFHKGFVKDLGESEQAFIEMGKEAEKEYCDWYAKNCNKIRLFYTTKP